MAKKQHDDEESGMSEDGHVLLEGSRWHYPKIGEPTVCAVRGCTRVLGQRADEDSFDDDEPDEPGEPTAA